MLKRQRPLTPPPPSLGDSPLLQPDGPIRPLQSPYIIDSFQPRSKRQRIHPPPLDGALRGWSHSEPSNLRPESDGEEDWIEDESSGSPLLPSTTTDQYKDANSLLHELHVLHQQRLLFPHSCRDQRLNPSPRIPPTVAYTRIQDSPAGQGRATWTNGDKQASRTCCVESTDGKELVEEVQFVRQRYEDINRFLGLLFLSRKREVEGTTSFADCSSSS